MSCICSQFLAQMPTMKPNRLKVTAVINMNATIHSGCRIVIGTKNEAVVRMMRPSNTDLVAAAPT